MATSDVNVAKDVQEMKDKEVVVHPFVTFFRAHYQNLVLVVLAILGVLTAMEPERFMPLFTMSYKMENKDVSDETKANDYFDDTTYYMYGRQDVFLLITIALVLTYLRYIYQHLILKNFCWAIGIRYEMKIQKFQDAGWFALWYPAAFAYGFWVQYKMPNIWSTGSFDCLWKTYPDLPIPFHLKFFIMVQISMWWHCMLVIHIEEKRKDYVAMVTHHVVTIILTCGALFDRFTRGGAFTMVLLDAGDILLYNLKLMTYLGGIFSKIANLGFVFFMVVWVITRHILFIMLLYSFSFRLPVLHAGNFGPGLYNMTTRLPIYQIAFVILQIVLIFWLYLIVKMAVGFIATGGKDLSDVRSDYEDNDDLDVRAKDADIKMVRRRRKLKAEKEAYVS